MALRSLQSLFDSNTITLNYSINLSLKGLDHNSINEPLHSRYDEDMRFNTLSVKLSHFWEHSEGNLVVHLIFCRFRMPIALIFLLVKITFFYKYN